MHPALHQRGFTLVEVLVVLLIVGIMSGGVSMALDTARRNDADDAIERLRRTLEASAERAAIQGRPIAIDFLTDGYRFSALDANGRWRPFEHPPIHVGRTLPSTLRIEGVRLTTGQGTASPRPLQRRLILAARSPRYELILNGPRGRIVLTGDPTGRVSTSATLDVR